MLRAACSDLEEGREETLVVAIRSSSQDVCAGRCEIAGRRRGDYEVHPARAEMDVHKINVQLTNIQRQLRLQRGVRGQWTPEAQERLLAFLRSPPNIARAGPRALALPAPPPGPLAIEDGVSGDVPTASSDSSSDSSSSSDDDDSNAADQADADPNHEGEEPEPADQEDAGSNHKGGEPEQDGPVGGEKSEPEDDEAQTVSRADHDAAIAELEEAMYNTEEALKLEETESETLRKTNFALQEDNKRLKLENECLKQRLQTLAAEPGASPARWSSPAHSLHR